MEEEREKGKEKETTQGKNKRSYDGRTVKGKSTMKM